MSSETTVSLSQTSVLSPMGIRQNIVNFDDRFDDEESFIVFPTDAERNSYDNDQSQFYYQEIMPRCHELIQLFSDGAESTAKEFISLMDKAICNAKEEILKEKDCLIQKDILYQYASPLVSDRKPMALNIMKKISN